MQLRSVLILVLAVVLSVPAASATHWSLYYSDVDASAGATFEDDGSVIDAPGHPLHGEVNRVVAPGQSPGDGGRFLDTRIGNGPSVNVYAGNLFENGRERLLPGVHDVSAWYGDWSDLDGNGVIADEHDAACAGAPCPTDEFVWRGLGSGNGNLAMKMFSYPASRGTSIGTLPRLLVPGTFAGYGAYDDFARSDILDRTSHQNEEQGWVGVSTSRVDHGFLATVQTLTVAGARALLGDPVTGYDLDDPEGRVDVDVYDAVSPDVETLYKAVIAAHYAATDPLVPASEEINERRLSLLANTLPLATAVVSSTVALVIGFVNTPEQSAYALYRPADLKEPNHPLDDFEGRALFGGVGDISGSFNSYADYLDGFHLYLDTVARTAACGGAYAKVPAAAVEVSNSVCQTGIKGDAVHATEADPLGAQFAGSRSAGPLLIFESHFFLWKDVNGDTHVGDVCDASDPAQFDGTRNTCSNAPKPWPHKASPPEIVQICANAHAKGTSFTVTPIGGEWDRAVVVRNVHESTRVAFEPTVLEIPTGAEAVTLNWRDECRNGVGTAPTLVSRDAIMFPDGSNRVPLLVRTEVRLPGYYDATLGVDIGDEGVTDYDLLPAAF